MITRTHHVALFVTNVERSIEFYTSTLGFKLISRSDNWGGPFLDTVCGGITNLKLNIALIDVSGQIIELIQVLKPIGMPTDAREPIPGIARIGFEVDDVESTVETLKQRGVRFMSDIITVTVKPEEHYSDGKAVKFRDPDGIILELQQPAKAGRVT